MTRAVARAVLGATLLGAGLFVSACSGGKPDAVAPRCACPLLAELAQTGDTVAKADVSDPAEFDATLKAAVASYVKTARLLQDAVPFNLRSDVERIVAAAEQYRFEDAISARADI